MSAPMSVGEPAQITAPPARLGVKLFIEDPASFDRDRLIALFHQWIQKDRLDGGLIDVHDYTHVPGGPGVVLISYEGHVRTDEADGRVGLEYEWKREASGGFGDRVRSTLTRTLEAATALEEDTAGGDPIRFRTDEWVFRFTDRLAVPNSEAAFVEVAAKLRSVLSDLYGKAEFVMERVGGSGAPLTVHVRVPEKARLSLASLLARARSESGANEAEGGVE